MAYNTTEDLYAFLSLTAEDVQPSVVQRAIETANEIVVAFAPTDATDRSSRMDTIRKLAEKYLAASEIFLHFANAFFLSQPPIRILNVLNFGAGADSPTPTELLSALDKVSEMYREQGMSWLRKVKPVTTTIRAGS
jgi:hypothetical protein